MRDTTAEQRQALTITLFGLLLSVGVILFAWLYNPTPTKAPTSSVGSQ